MATHPTKLEVMERELERLITETPSGAPRATVVDFNTRKSPGPITDEEWLDLVRDYAIKRGTKLVAVSPKSRQVRVG